MVQNRKRAIWSNKDLPVLDTDIDKVELQLDFHFPEYFRERIKKINGGSPTPSSFMAEEGEWSIDNLLSFRSLNLKSYIGTHQPCEPYNKYCVTKIGHYTLAMVIMRNKLLNRSYEGG